MAREGIPVDGGRRTDAGWTRRRCGNVADVTWNAGVLEHFSFSEQVRALREMKRVTRAGGLVVSLNPNARCLPYRAGKYAAEQTGWWHYGDEHPVATLAPASREAGLSLLREYPIGFLDGLEFLAFIPGGQHVRHAMEGFYNQLSEEERDMFAGYLLVSVMRRTAGRKPARRRSAGCKR